MTLNIQFVHNVQESMINIKKPISYPKDEMTVFDIYYNNDIFLILLNFVQVCQKGKHIKFIESTNNINHLQNILNNIITRAKESKKYSHLFSKKEWYNMIEDNVMLHFKNICEYDTRIFDIENTPIDFDKIKKNDNVSLIVYVKNIWINDKYYGINMKLSQVQRREPLGLSKSLFPVSALQTPSIPPPPPPPPNARRPLKPKIEIVRPSLKDILNSREKLRKTNLLS